VPLTVDKSAFVNWPSALLWLSRWPTRPYVDAPVADPVGHPGFASIVADLQPAVEGADDLEGRASPHTKAKAVNAAKRINLNSSLLDWVCIHFGCKIKLNTEDVERAEVNSSKSRNEIAG